MEYKKMVCEISSSHGGEYDVHVRTSKTLVNNRFTRQYIPEDNSEQENGTL
jgi:hypothetical protein